MAPPKGINKRPFTKPTTTVRRAAPPAAPSRKRPAATSKPTPRKRAVIDSSKIIGSFTSNAERRRRKPTCSLTSLRNLEDEITLESDFVGYFGATSESHCTWGKTETQPIAATKRKGKAPRFKKNSAKDNIAALFDSGENLGPKIPNSAERSFFLRFPLEIREKVYGIFFLYPKPILVKYDLGSVERDNLRNRPILRVCKQISDEASSFLYRQNVFRAILRKTRATPHLHESFIIDPKFLSFFRNVIIECQKDNYSLDWYEVASLSIEKLVQAKAVLQSLTIVVLPQRVGVSETAVGVEAHPITFADFFWFPGRFMTAIRNLPCKQLNIVFKKTYKIPGPADHLTPAGLNGNPQSGVMASANVIITKRFLISLDLTYLARSPLEEGFLRNPETVNIQVGKDRAIRQELLSLKEKFEDIFIDGEKAVEQGKCRMIGEDEKITDVVAFPIRK
jgi:hypothetical protein